MNTNEQDINRLTRRLMDGTTERPSTSLNSRIMALIMGKKRIQKIYVRRLPSLKWIFALTLIYSAGILSGILYGNSKINSQLAECIAASKPYFPVILLVLSSLSFFCLFTQLDKWLRKKGI